MSKPIHLLYISDNKAGHRSQALGLLHAFKARHPNQPIKFQEILATSLSYLSLFSAYFLHRPLNSIQAPDYIIGVGSHTHLKVALLARQYPQAKSIILMKSSLPFSWFDYHIIPEHDRNTLSKAAQQRPNILFTQGVLNPIHNEHRHQTNRILVAIGGSSKRHQWDQALLLQQLQQLIQHTPDQEWIITTSRRTPADFITQLSQQPYANTVQIFPVDQTPQGWIFEQMQLADTVWVTEDSMSMIFEALTSGAKVGLLPMRRLKSDRITRLLDELLQHPQPLTMTLNEADRVAQMIFFPVKK